MVIERFKQGATALIGQRFREKGRMLPQGAVYHASWVDPAGIRCFQIMEAPSPAILDAWIHHWNDLIDFEVIPVVASADFWATHDSKQRNPAD